MCNFNLLDDERKKIYHDQLVACANSFGGKNFFLQLLEAIRKNKPHPLVSKHCEFKFLHGSVKWNKVIFQDKLTLLMKVRLGEKENVLPSKDDKSYKNVFNLVRTLNPINFECKPALKESGDGFELHAFDVIDENNTKLNPLFNAIFFCSIDTVKKILNFEVK